MIVQLQLVGLALAGKMLTHKTRGTSIQQNTKTLSRPHTRHIYSKRKKATVPNPLQTLFKGLSSSLSRIIQKPSKEDYDVIVERYLPENAKLLTPRNPANAAITQLVDLDGDLQKELVASYMLDNETKTLILKKQNDQWHEIAKITNPNCVSVDFRDFADLTGEGKKQMLLGTKTKEGLKELCGYSLQSGKINKLFTHNFTRLEVLNHLYSRNDTSKAHIAIWKKTDTGTYNIEVMQWNGSMLELVKNQTPYYYNRVLPYLGMKVKQMPQKASNWYYLADALTKAEMELEALTAIEMGLKLNPNPLLKQEFLALREKNIKK